MHADNRCLFNILKLFLLNQTKLQHDLNLGFPSKRFPVLGICGFVGGIIYYILLIVKNLFLFSINL